MMNPVSGHQPVTLVTIRAAVPLLAPRALHSAKHRKPSKWVEILSLTNSTWQLDTCLFRFRTCQFTTMPAGGGLVVAFALKQFFAPCHLGITAVPNLEPCASLPIRDVGSGAVLGYNSF